ncbi:MAG: metallophosphoesterase [Fibrobacter sp.]|uniref:metallophosphoesterase n=1 Tax=Fibrobacter sp. TaxID=35828 RepID=UPI0025BECD9A|nr:metallophosphoesterase [Fibrobacter sp.]MBQ9227071.1 metallophosphoesterase [Fibrobacter sp.]
MFIFLFILLAGLALIYINVSAVAPGKMGKLVALGVLVAIFAGMSFRDTLAGSAVVAFTSVWLCQALLVYIPWGIFRLVRRIVRRAPMEAGMLMRVSRGLLAFTVALTAGLFLYGVPHNSEYKLIETRVELPARYFAEPQAGDASDTLAKLEAAAVVENRAFTAVFFSDIHVDPLFDRAKLERMIAHVDSLAPDYLLFGGDLADVPTPKLDEWGYDSLFKTLTSKAKIAAVAINGNHEGMQERPGSDPDSWMRKVGFVMLDDSSACIGPACFTGRTDFQVARHRDIDRLPLATIAPRDTTRPWILLDHQPKGIEPEYSGRLPDYALSGHTHNGQFFPGNIVINFVWRLAFGEGVLDGVRWLVSAGVDCWGPPVRVGTDADMWVLHFVAGGR